MPPPRLPAATDRQTLVRLIVLLLAAFAADDRTTPVRSDSLGRPAA